MNDQNIYGDHNVSNQYNGDVSLTSLDIVELAREHELARKVVASERRRRTGGSLVLAIIAVVGIVVGYVFFVNCGDLTIADIFNNFASKSACFCKSAPAVSGRQIGRASCRERV